MLKVDEVGWKLKKVYSHYLMVEGIIIFPWHHPLPLHISSTQFPQINVLDVYFKINFGEGLFIQVGCFFQNWYKKMKKSLPY